MSCKAYKAYIISKLNLYFRELTHGHTGSPEHLIRKWRINVQMRWYYAYKIHQGYSITKMNLYSRELTHGRTGSARTSIRN